MISVIEAIAIYHNIRKSQYKSFSTSPHTQLPFSLSQLLTPTRYLWVQSFNRTQRKIGAYNFASQPFTSRVMSTIILYENLHLTGYIQPDLSNTQCLPKDTSVKRKGEDHHDSCLRVEGKNKRQALRRGMERLSCAFMVGCTKS